MSALFQKKQLTPAKRVCLRLKEARESKGLSLEEMETKTKISKKYLQALEQCRFNDLPVACIYQQNFVKAYVNALGLNPDSFLSQYLAEEKIESKIKHPHKVLKQSWFGNLPNLIRLGGAFLVILLITVYLGWQVKRIVEPPQLTLFSPEEGYVTSDPTIYVQGQTDKEVRVYLNGKEIKNNENGQFNEKVDLGIGVNTLMVMVEKKHGKQTTEIRHVVLKENKTLSFVQTPDTNNLTP